MTEHYYPTPRRKAKISEEMASAILKDYRDPDTRVLDILGHYRIPVSVLYRLIRQTGTPFRNTKRQEPV